MSSEGLLDGSLRVRSMTLPDTFIDQASPAEMYAEAGLTKDDIAKKVLKTLGVSTAEFGQASA